MKDALKTDSKDHQITLYGVIYISEFIYLELGAFIDSGYMSLPQILSFFCAHGISENKWKLWSLWRPLEGSPNLLIYQCLFVSASDGVQQQVNILR